MKTKNLLFVVAASAFVFTGCTKKPAVTSSIASSEAASSVVNSTVSENITSSDQNSFVVSENTGSALEAALKKDYSNMYAEVTQSYSDGDEGEYAYETYYNGYTIVYDEVGASAGGDAYLYYHTYNGKSYLYFTPDTNAPTPKAAWLNKGYMDADLSLSHTYFSMEAFMENITADDVSYASGTYYVKSAEKVQQLNETVFSFAWYNDLTDISFTISEGVITSITGYDDLNNEKNYVKIVLKSVGEATFDETKLPEAPNEDNVMEYWQYKGWDGPYVDKYVTSITASVLETSSDPSYDAVIDIEKSVKISASYLPEDANKHTIYWRSSDETVAKVTYDKEGNKIIYGVGEGEATIYAYNDENKAGEVVSNGLKVKVNGLKAQNKEGAVYDLTYTSMIDDNIVVENALDNNLPVSVTAEKTVVQNGKNSEIWAEEDMCVVMDPSTNGVGASVVTYDFGDQQVSGISFYYALYYNTGVSNLSFLQSAVIETSNDGENWTTIDIKDEIVDNISVVNLKLMEKTFAPASLVRISLDTNFTGKNIHFAYTEMAFIADENCHAHEDTPEEVAVESVSVSAEKTTLYAGKDTTLSALVLPADASDKTYTWVSSDTSVVSVDADGKLHALKEGSAEVYAVSTSGNVESNKLTITVNAALNVDSKVVGKWVGEADSGIENVTVVVNADNSANVTYGEDTFTLTLTDYEDYYYVFSDDNADDVLKIKASSSMENTADVSMTLGTLTVGKYSGAKEYSKVVALESITLSADKTSVTEGGTIKLSTKLNPSNTTDKSLTWSSDNEEVATVSATGVVTAKKAGTVTISVTSEGGVSESIILTVNAKTYPTAITVTGSSTSVEEGSKIQLSANVTPSDVSEKNVTWSSDNTDVATVDANGLVTTKKAGTVIIKATSANGEVNGTYTLTVTASESGIPSDLVGIWEGYSSMCGNVTLTISANGEAILIDENALEDDFTYTSEEDGVYTFTINDGSDTFTLTLTDGTLTMGEWYCGNVYIEGDIEFTK